MRCYQSLIASCCFVYISKGEDGILRLQIIEASDATGVIDPITGLLTEGYAVLRRDNNAAPILEAYFTDKETIFYKGKEKPLSVPNKTGRPLLVPIIHRADAVRPFGRSRITRSAMYYQRYAKRTLERADVTAEFYSFPQKYVVGLSQDAEPMDTWKATVSSMLQFTKDDEGGTPSLGQFNTSSMSPFTEQLRTAAAGFAGEMGLTLDDLGFVSDNPSSVEAIRASHEGLRLAGKKAQRSLGSGFLNVAYVSVCLRDDFAYSRTAFMETKPKWEPLFESDASALGLIGDAALKLNQAIPGLVDEEMIAIIQEWVVIMDKDIVPALLEAIQKDFDNGHATSKQIQQLLSLLAEDKATYLQANNYAVEVGKLLSKALKNKVTVDALPNGKMYFNIAEKLFNATLKNNYDLIADYSSKVQAKVNNDVGIRLKAQTPKLNQDRVDGLIKAAANAKDFEEVSRLLGDPIVNFSQSVVDNTIKANAEFLDKAGFKSKIKRIAVGRDCKWCRNLEGVYDYPHTPEEIYHRHENCRCRVDYFPNGKRSRYKQNVHSKKYIKANSEELKKLSDEVGSKNKNRNKPLEILAITEAKKLGYNPLPTSKVVNELRKQARKWEKF